MTANNCSIEAAIENFYDEYGTPLSDYISDCMVVIAISIIPFILVFLLKIQRSKFIVTENTIKGKKGYKKFDFISAKTSKKFLILSLLKH